MSNDTKKTRNDRIRSKSPFPSAYRIIANLEVDKEPTLQVPVSQELLEACKRRQGVRCDNCGTWDETGLDWNMVATIEEGGDPSYKWYCKVCVKGDKEERSDFVLSGQEIEHPVDKVDTNDD